MIRAFTLRLLALWLTITAFALSPAYAFGKPVLTAAHVIKQEIRLNRLIADIHLLQLDFQNVQARERLLDHLAVLDGAIPNFPREAIDQETSNLLGSTLALWPVISRHTSWVGQLPPESPVPEATTLLLALAKLDRQLLLLRQKLLTDNPMQNKTLNFLEQALLMQKLSREYLSLTVTSQQQEQNASGRSQLQTLAQHFEQRLERMRKIFNRHPHAGQPIRQAHAAWKFISGNIETFPSSPAPEMVALYSDRIVSRLTSVHQMF